MRTTSRPAWAFAFVVIGILNITANVRAHVPAPPPPDVYRVYLRYSLNARGFNRLFQFRDMVDRLKAIGFQKDEGPPDEEIDATFTTMTGTIAAKDARLLLTVFPVKTVLLYPKDYTLPAEDPKEPVKVAIYLPETTGIATRRQVAVQLRPYLEREGFREFIAYDNRRQTRIVGTIPAGRVENLLNDLTVVPLENPPAEPLRFPWPIRLVEVTPGPRDVEEIKPFVPLPEPPPELATISPDLRARLPLPGDKAGEPERVEVILRTAPRDRRYEELLTSTAPRTSIEHRLGSVVAIKTGLENVAALARLSEVNAIRLPRPAAPVFTQIPVDGDAVAEALRNWSVDCLHRAGARGKGIRVAVIADDFRGYRRFLGSGLPAATRLIDLTAERTEAIEPEPPADDKREFGTGTDLALAVALAAPEAELVLVRVGNTAPYQLDTLARYISGQAGTSPALNYRNDELKADEAALRNQREILRRERQAVLDDFSQEDAARQRRQEYEKRQADFDARDVELRRRKERYAALLRDLSSLRGVPVVVSALVWDEGYPIGGESVLTHRLNDAPPSATVWLQAAGDSQGQAWTGPFRDEDDNGVMEFAPANEPLRPERWSPELNFLAWKPHAAAKPVEDLPEKIKLRLSLQWREAHDPELASQDGDPYRPSLANLHLTVLRQRDPTGKKLPADEMEVVARSAGLPMRIDTQPESAVYEQVLEFELERSGRYAVRIEGRPRLSTRPTGLLSLRGQEKFWELRPRLFVQAPGAKDGRPVWLDYESGAGDVGMPADAHAVLTVGSVDGQGRVRSYTSLGPPHDLGVLRKPDLFVPDGFRLREQSAPATGTAISAGFAAGAAASALSGGIPPQVVYQQWRNRGGTSWVMPPLPPPPPKRR